VGSISVDVAGDAPVVYHPYLVFFIGDLSVLAAQKVGRLKVIVDQAAVMDYLEKRDELYAHLKDGWNVIHDIIDLGHRLSKLVHDDVIKVVAPMEMVADIHWNVLDLDLSIEENFWE